MRQFTIAAATVAIAALISAAPASAERLQGGPIKQNGKCWQHNASASEASWGTWVACPQTASTPAVRHVARHRT
jgi:hypothetical protein